MIVRVKRVIFRCFIAQAHNAGEYILSVATTAGSAIIRGVRFAGSSFLNITAVVESASVVSPTAQDRARAATGARRTVTLRGRGLAAWDRTTRVVVGGGTCEVQEELSDGTSPWVTLLEQRAGTGLLSSWPCLEKSPGCTARLACTPLCKT